MREAAAPAPASPQPTPVVEVRPAPTPVAQPKATPEPKPVAARWAEANPAPAPPQASAPTTEFRYTPPPVARRQPTPAPAPRPVNVVRPAPAPVVETKPARVATMERPAPQQIASVVLTKAPPEPEQDLDRPGLATRVAALPRVLLDTVAWGGFAAVVALIVIALSDVGMGRAALWATGLSGIVVLAVAVMAVTGTHLDELSHASKSMEGSD